MAGLFPSHVYEGYFCRHFWLMHGFLSWRKHSGRKPNMSAVTFSVPGLLSLFSSVLFH